MYIVNANGYVSKWKPGAVEGEIVVNTGYGIGSYSSVFVDSSGNIYYSRTI